MLYETIVDAWGKNIMDMGAFAVGKIKTDEIMFYPEFRAACEVNSCGKYGKCWTCPPYIGEIDTLIENARKYKAGVVFQTVTKLEDSFDIEGMELGAQLHNKLVQKIQNKILGENQKALLLGAGGCQICDTCSKEKEEPCRFPNKAIASLEAYGIGVTPLAEKSELKYNNGADTVTYFGLILFDDEA